MPRIGIIARLECKRENCGFVVVLLITLYVVIPITYVDSLIDCHDQDLHLKVRTVDCN